MEKERSNGQRAKQWTKDTAMDIENTTREKTEQWKKGEPIEKDE